MLTRPRAVAAALLLSALVAAHAHRLGAGGLQGGATAAVVSPRAHFGAAIGDDYFLATWPQLEDYWRTLAAASGRMRLVEIGRTEEGRPQLMAIVSAEENLARLDEFRGIARRLALAEGVGEAEARALAREGRAVVAIAGGLHADEVLGAQQLIELVYQLVHGEDEETRRIRRDVIVLALHANPDGHALVADWYMRESDPARRSLEHLPRAYQKYVGHDNNRDFYLASQAETININRVLYREWFPQIVYDHHQTAPRGTVMFAPPFRGPANPHLDPLALAGIDLAAGAMHARFAAEDKRGVTRRAGGTYSIWWNGGLRTTASFHNQIGLLTETAGGPTPSRIPFVAAAQTPGDDLPAPIAPQPWRFEQSVAYSMTANRAVLDYASRYREALLTDVWMMGARAIARGQADSWTRQPDEPAGGDAPRDPDRRDPRGYILPAGQPDFPTAVKFADALIKAGVVVQRATAPFAVGAAEYPAGSLVVKTAQAFRAHVLDMFEPQRHPHDVPYPGAPPTPPYDAAGWTLALQMGVRFARVLDAFDGPFERLDRATPPARTIAGAGPSAGFLLSHHQNDAALVVNRVLAAGGRAYWPRDRAFGPYAGDTGAIYVEGPGVEQIVAAAAAERGAAVTRAPVRPPGEVYRLRPARIALWDRYGGASSSGWIRWLLEQYEFPFTRVYAPELDAGGLAARYDVIVLPDDAVPAARAADAPDASRVPAEYRRTLGTMTWDATVPRLREFVEQGGTLVAIGGAAAMAGAVGAAVRPAATLPRERFYIPASVVRARVDPAVPLGFGFAPDVDVLFDRSPVFAATDPRARRVAWYDSAAPLRSGWALGQDALAGGLAVVEAPVGRGTVVLFGPEIAFRGQAHGTFKFLFNALHYATAERLAHVQ